MLSRSIQHSRRIRPSKVLSIQQRSYKTHQFENDDLNLSEENQHNLTRALRTMRNEERKLYQEAKKVKDTTEQYKNAKVELDENGKFTMELPKEKTLSFDEYIQVVQEKSSGYPWVLGPKIRQALHHVEQGAAESYTPLLKYRQEDLRVYQVAKKLHTMWQESDSEKPITYDDIEFAFNLYKVHCENMKMMKSEYSLEYTKLMKVLINVVLVNREYCKVAKQVLNESTKKYKKDIASIESAIESKLKEYESTQSNQDKLLMLRLNSYTIQSISKLDSDLDAYENMVVQCVKLMYPERCIIYDLDLCKKLLYICRTTTASSLLEKRKEIMDVSTGHYDREKLFQQAIVICKESEQDSKILSHPYELERPIL